MITLQVIGHAPDQCRQLPMPVRVARRNGDGASRPLYVLSLAVFVLFLQSYALEHLVFSGAVDLTFVLGMLAGATAVLGVMQRRRLRTPVATDFCILAFSSILLLSALLNQAGFMFTCRILLASVLPYFLARLYVLDDASVARTIGNVALTVAVVYALTSLAHAFWLSGGDGRISLGGATPIAGAEVVGIGAVTAFTRASASGRRRRRWLFGILGLVCLMAQVAALGSRGSVAAALLTLVLIFAATPRLRKRGFTLVALVALVGAALIIGQTGVAGRFEINAVLRDPSVVGSERYVGRAQLWSLSLYTMAQAPILGAGPGVVYSHNLFLEVGSGLGVLGLAMLGLILGSVPWRRLLAATRRNDAVGLILALFLFTLIYRQTSFALDGHKTLFAFLGFLVGMGYHGPPNRPR